MEGLLRGLEWALEQELGTPVGLVVLNRAPVDLVHRGLRDGLLLVNRNPSKRVQFEVKSRNAYFDLKSVLDDYRRARTEV